MNARKTGRKQHSTKSNRQHASQQTETARDQILYKATFHVNFQWSNKHFACCLAMQLPSKKTEMPNTSGTGYWPSIELRYPNLESNQSSPNHLHFHVGKLISDVEQINMNVWKSWNSKHTAVCRLGVSGTGRASLEGMTLVEDVWVWTFYTLPPNSPKQTMSDFSWKDGTSI